MREGSALRGGERGVFFPAMERTKDRRGTPSVRTLPAAVRTGGFPPDPYLRERATSVRQLFPAGKIKTCFRPILGPLGPFAIKICKCLLLSYTASCIPTCLVRPSSIA